MYYETINLVVKGVTKILTFYHSLFQLILGFLGLKSLLLVNFYIINLYLFPNCTG